MSRPYKNYEMVHQYSPEIEKKIRRHLRPTNDSWRVNEIYIKVKGEWKYLYRADDSDRDTIDFMLRAYPKSLLPTVNSIIGLAHLRYKIKCNEHCD